MHKKWIIRPFNEDKVNGLQQELRISKTLCSLLINREIDTFEKAEKYFRPSLEHLNPPFEMLNMEKAAKCIIGAVEKNQKIMVYGDYDVDGTTAVSVMYLFLKSIGADVIYYIPDRYSEGYGVSEKGVELAISAEIQLMITLDCGISAFAEIKMAKDAGIDVIVCDHHLPADKLPEAFAILDPKQQHCPYPFKELSGCGVGFKLMQAIGELLDLPDSQIFRYLDLIAISTASDIVPLIEENRVLVKYGLEKLNSDPSWGVRELIEISGATKAMSVGDVVFKIGPRINAAGRLVHAKEAVQMFVSEDDEVRSQKASFLNQNNSERQNIDATITSQVLEMISNSDELISRKSTVLFDPSWHKGVIGIVASRAMETYYRPTIIFTSSNGVLTGSARSVKGFDIHNALGKCKELFINYGGHKYAAGITMKEENLSQFSSEFEEIVSSTIDPDQLIQSVYIDTIVELSDLNEKFYNVVQQMAPFGPSNMRPVFAANGLMPDQYARIVGKDHLKFNCYKDGVKIPAIGFSLGKHIERLKNDKFSCCFTVEMNEWNGNSNLQLNIKDIKFDS